MHLSGALRLPSETGARQVLAAIRDTRASDADRKRLTTIILKSVALGRRGDGQAGGQARGGLGRPDVVEGVSPAAIPPANSPGRNVTG
jgi:hypothetical protein